MSNGDRAGHAEEPAIRVEPASADLVGRADLHVHTLASDGLSTVEDVLDHAENRLHLDVIAITDHERVDAALAAREIARSRGLRVQVIIGEEITTRGGHLIGLFLHERIRPWLSMKESVARVHEQGGIAIVAHPLVPYPLCASSRTLRRLYDEGDPVFHPDAVEAFNPTTAGTRWSRRVPDFIAEMTTTAVAGSDAHRATAIGHAQTLFAGATPEELRAAIESGATGWQGNYYSLKWQLGTFRLQLAKNARALRDDVAGKVLLRGTGRDLGYPGGNLRPPRFRPAPTDPAGEAETP